MSREQKKDKRSMSKSRFNELCEHNGRGHRRRETRNASEDSLRGTNDAKRATV